MNANLCCRLAASLLACLPIMAHSALTAQDGMQMPSPAKELAAFNPLLGHFTGKGTATDGPDASETMNWTAKIWTRKVLGGFWIRSDETIELAGVPTPLVFKTYFGYDQTLKRHIGYTISNTGDIATVRVHFAGQKMVTVADTFTAGQRKLEQWTTEFKDKGMSILGLQSVDGGEFFAHVKGTYSKQSGKSEQPQIVHASFTMPGMPNMPAVDTAMGKLEGLTGQFKFKGGMQMMPGAPDMPISGHSITELVYGGRLLETRLHGDPSPMGKYEGWGAMAWNADEKCYVQIYCDNMGGFESAKGWWVGKDFVSTATTPSAGNIPAVHRSVAKFGSDGKLVSEVRHSTIGTHKPTKTFYLDYKSQKQE